MLGYFSPVRYDAPPSLHEAVFLRERALWVGLFGDLGFLHGRWPILGRSENWNSDDWPLTDFAHHEEFSGRCYRISYGGNLRNQVTRTLSSPEDLNGLSQYGVGGAGFVEAKLSRLLSN